MSKSQLVKVHNHLFLDHTFLLPVDRRLRLQLTRTSIVVVSRVVFDGWNQLRIGLDVAEAENEKLEDFPVAEVQSKNLRKFFC